MALSVGSLFSGIGGIDLGLERAGMVTRWFCEIDPHCRNVLARHWPGLPIYGDITAVDWSGVERVDVLAGGFPCQPVSSAGKQEAQADTRWLWPEFARAIRALRPRYVLVENVANLLAVNGGSAMGEVIGDLAACGYDSEWDCIPAEAVGALHERDRLWLVAYPSRVQPGRKEQRAERQRAGAGREPVSLAHADSGRRKQRDERVGRVPVVDASSPTLADASRNGWGERRPESAREQGRSSTSLSGPAMADTRSGGSPRSRQPIQSVYSETRSNREATEPIDGRLAGQWLTEPDVGRVAHGVPHRVDRLRSLGNAVVPQVVEWIGRRIVAFDEGREMSAVVAGSVA